MVVAAGASGAPSYRQVAGEIAKLGYDAVLVEANGWAAQPEQKLREAIAVARQMPHALPGKVGLVGFSLGGGYVLGYGTAWSDQVAVVAAWYPATSALKDVAGWAGRVKVPTVMFAGENDTYNRCCLSTRRARSARPPWRRARRSSSRPIPTCRTVSSWAATATSRSPTAMPSPARRRRCARRSTEPRNIVAGGVWREMSLSP